MTEYRVQPLPIRLLGLPVLAVIIFCLPNPKLKTFRERLHAFRVIAYGIVFRPKECLAIMDGLSGQPPKESTDVP